MQQSTTNTVIELTSQTVVNKQVCAKSPDHRKKVKRLQVLRSMDKWFVFAAVSVRTFLFSGCNKSNGVFLDDLVQNLNSSHSLVAWAFALQVGISFMAAPITRMLLKVFSYRQIAVTGGFIVGVGYIYCGLFAVSVGHLFGAYIFSGFGFSLTILPSYLALREQFLDHFPTVSSASTLFQFAGMCLVPPLVKALKDLYGVNQSLILVGAILWNLVACGVAVRLPHRKENPPNVTKNQKKTEYPVIVKIEKEEAESQKEETNANNEIIQGSNIFTRAKRIFFISSLDAHGNFAFVLMLVFVGSYVMSSWSIFLISHGKAQGLTAEFAVLLTTAGGVGGLVGKVTGTLLFHFRKMSPYVCCLPYLITGLSFLICAFVGNAFVIFGCTFVAGMTQGLTSCSVHGTIPMIVCKYHLPQAFSLVSFLRGVTVQCSGLFSGLLFDAFGSTRYVFAFNAVLCFAVAPLVFFWIRNDQTVKQCHVATDSVQSIKPDSEVQSIKPDSEVNIEQTMKRPIHCHSSARQSYEVATF